MSQPPIHRSTRYIHSVHSVDLSCASTILLTIASFLCGVITSLLLHP